jgi:hypothetical protein
VSDNLLTSLANLLLCEQFILPLLNNGDAMLRFRALTLLTLILSAFGLRYGLRHSDVLFLPTEQISYTGWEIFFSTLALLTCPFFVITTTGMLLLSFLALSVGEDGAFVIRRKNLYGKLFSYLANNGNSWKSFSYCKVFWRTNLILFLLSFLLGFLALFAFAASQVGWWQALLKIALLIGLIVAMVGLAAGLTFTGEKIAETNTWQRVRESKVATVTKGATVGFIVLLLIGFVSLALWSLLKDIPLKWLGAGVGVIVALVVIIRGTIFVWDRWLSKSGFGVALSHTYSTYLCPRLRIE